MALFFAGKSKCALCERIIAASEDFTLFPAFVMNKLDPMARFSDVIVHCACLEMDDAGAEAVACRDEALARSSPSARICVVCKTVITEPDEYFGSGYLAPEITPVGRFNYIHLHRSHFPEWAHHEDFQRAIEEHVSSVAWDGPVVVFDPLPRWISGRRSTIAGAEHDR